MIALRRCVRDAGGWGVVLGYVAICIVPAFAFIWSIFTAAGVWGAA